MRKSRISGVKPVRRLLGWLTVLLVLSWTETARAESSGRLVVFTTEYCTYCKEFMENVAPHYSKTRLGRRFPMTQVDNFSPPGEWEDKAWQIRFYPTFLVLDQAGRSLGEFRGYRGEEPFWGELEGIVARIPSGR
ncbi:MAG: hypothetical protein HQM02_09980 [Magnetococcales bacterium]|nr:hypothetical protein [Magnetococcales bacterium]